MTNKDTVSAFLSHICGITICFLAIFINDIFVWNNLYGENISFIEQGNITFVRLSGYISASITLLIVIKFYSPRKLLIGSILLYCLSLIFIIILSESILSSIWFIIYYAAIIAISMLLFVYVLLDKRINQHSSILIYSLSVLLAYIILNIAEYSSLTIRSYLMELEFIILNIILLGGFAYYSIFMLPCKEKIIQNNYRFFAVIKNMEIEIIIGFSIFYTIMVMQNSYMLFALGDSLIIFGKTTKIFIRAFSIILALFLNNIYMINMNKHQVSLYCIAALNLLFVSMPYWGLYTLSAILGNISIILALFILFSSSILILAEKFTNINLFSSLSFYLIAAVFGYYCGYVTVNSEIDSFGVNGFLISICFVLINLFFYCLYCCRKYKLL